MSIVINQGGNWVQGSSYIGYDNLYLRSTAAVAASSEDVGFPGSSGVSWLTSGGGWQTTGVGDKTLAVTLPTTETAQAFAIYKHNLGTLGLTIKLQESTNATTWNDVPGSEQTPSNDEAIFWVDTDPSATVRYWRLHIAGLAAGETLKIAQAFIGPVLRVFNPPEAGWIPPNIALDDKYLNTRSEGGDFMGRTFVRKGSKTSFMNSLADEAWIRSDWLPFMKEAERHPFYHAWDTISFPFEVAYCYTDGKISKPKYVSSRFMSFDLKFFALLE